MHNSAVAQAKSNQVKAKREPKPLSLGEMLKQRRIAAGFPSLDAAVRALRGKDRAGAISKAMLNLLERDAVASVRPEILRKLASLYRVPYAELAMAWFCSRYELSVDDVVATHTFIESVDQDSASLLSGSGDYGPIEIISLSRLEEIQGKLPAKSHVCVAAVKFLDDGPYYQMVTRNLLRGVSYAYLLPEEGYPRYRAFVSRVEAEFPQLRGKLDGQLTQFFSRMSVEAPFSYAVFQLPDNSVQGYVGLLLSDIVQYFQVADAQLSYRLLEGFAWSKQVATDAPLRRRLSELGAEFVSRRGGSARKPR